jgi:hypothetical protein
VITLVSSFKKNMAQVFFRVAQGYYSDTPLLSQLYTTQVSDGAIMQGMRSSFQPESQGSLLAMLSRQRYDQARREFKQS